VYTNSNPTIIYVPKTEIIKIKSDSICKEDSKILSELEVELKKRESYSETVYTRIETIKSNGKIIKVRCYYFGFGHLLFYTNIDVPVIHVSKTITLTQADSLIKSDIRLAYWENTRLNRKTLFHDVYKIFISGKK
jgi:hypothetical protein